MTPAPRGSISVLLAVHDGMPFLPEVMDSILGQTWKRFELVVVDDSSTDATAEYLSSLRDRRLTVLRVEARNQAKALNAGLALCKGDWIARFDADDPAHPGRLAAFLAHAADLGPYGVVATRFRAVHDPAPVAWGPEPPGPGPLVDVTPELGLRNPIAHSAAFVRRAALAEIGGYDEDNDIMNDYLTWVRIAERGWRVGRIERVLQAVRIHPQQQYARIPRRRYVMASARVQWRASRKVLGRGVLPSFARVAARVGYGFVLPYGVRTKVRRWLDGRAS